MSIKIDIKEKKADDLLTEKYRPINLDDVVGQKKAVNDFKKYIKQRDLPDLIISGIAGVGKTTTATILAHKIAGRSNTLILDASQDNGIKVMRTTVKDFAMTYGDSDISTLKIIIFDEADNLTFQAQQSLRRTIEKCSKYFRCIFICNYIRKLIEPIQSRCIKYTFSKLKNEDILHRLNYICKKESLSITDDILLKIIENTNGDLRKCINVIDAINKGASPENFVKKHYDNKFMSLCIQGDLMKMKSYIENNVNDSHELSLILVKSLNLIIKSTKIPDEMKYIMINLIGECEYRLTLSSDFYICALWICSNIHKETLNYKSKHEEI